MRACFQNIYSEWSNFIIIIFQTNEVFNFSSLEETSLDIFFEKLHFCDNEIYVFRFHYQ